MGEEQGSVGAFRMARELTGGMRRQFRWSRVSWDGTRRDWEWRVPDHKTPRKAGGEPDGIRHGRGEGVFPESKVARPSAPDDTRSVQR